MIADTRILRVHVMITNFDGLTYPNDMQMHAILIKDDKGPAKNLYLGEAPKPQPRPGELLVKVNTYLRCYPNCKILLIFISRSRLLV
jgi:hypothetical protein